MALPIFLHYILTNQCAVTYLHTLRCGIKAGDVIVNLNGHVLRTIDNLQEVLLGDAPLLLEIRRGNDDLLFNIEPHVIRQ